MDEQGCILDNGSDKVRPWIGKHDSEVPGNCKIIVDIDPFEVLGLRGVGER